MVFIDESVTHYTFLSFIDIVCDKNFVPDITYIVSAINSHACMCEI